ncbi:uncharacterized protein LOC142646422 [Rhinoderma darwinii]|uniref:uncharacterized protein LOC142646422 n=1 Tax=Rhinoderma darwinii TaxID=43563 RepID=UPI003F6790FE
MPRYIQVERLIALVQDHVAIWDSRSDLYHDRYRKDAAWEEIARDMYPEECSRGQKSREAVVRELKTRWSNTRDQYKKDLRKQGKSGDAPTSKRPYIFSRQMEFMRPVLDLRTSTDNLMDETVVSNSDMEEAPDSESTNIEQSEEVNEVSATPETGARLASPSTVTEPLRRVSARRPRQAAPDAAMKAIIDAKVLEHLTTFTKEGEEELFLKSLAPLVRRIPLERRNKLQAAMVSVIDLFTPPNNPLPIVRAIQACSNITDEALFGPAPAAPPAPWDSSQSFFSQDRYMQPSSSCVHPGYSAAHSYGHHVPGNYSGPPNCHSLTATSMPAFTMAGPTSAPGFTQAGPSSSSSTPFLNLLSQDINAGGGGPSQ